jgi:hypothetical protein
MLKNGETSRLNGHVIDEIKIFIALVEKVSGKRIMIYSNESSY